MFDGDAQKLSRRKMEHNIESYREIHEIMLKYTNNPKEIPTICSKKDVYEIIERNSLCEQSEPKKCHGSISRMTKKFQQKNK